MSEQSPWDDSKWLNASERRRGGHRRSEDRYQAHEDEERDLLGIVISAIFGGCMGFVFGYIVKGGWG